MRVTNGVTDRQWHGTVSPVGLAMKFQKVTTSNYLHYFVIDRAEDCAIFIIMPSNATLKGLSRNPRRSGPSCTYI